MSNKIQQISFILLVIFVGCVKFSSNSVIIYVAFISAIILIISSIWEETHKNDSDNNNASDYKHSILKMLAAVIKADGESKECELEKVKSTIKRYYNTEREQKEAYKSFLSEIGNESDPFFRFRLSKLCLEIKRFSYASKSELIMELLAVAYADSDFNDKEIAIIKKIVAELEISETEFSSIVAIFKRKYDAKKYDAEKDYKYCILVLFAEIIKADRKKMENQVNELCIVRSAINQYYETSESQQHAYDLFISLINDENDINNVCKPINEKLTNDEKMKLISILLEIAYADDSLTSIESSIILKIAKNLNYTKNEYERIKKEFLKSHKKENSEKEESNNSYENNYSPEFCILVLLSEVMKADGNKIVCELDEVKAVITKLYKTEDSQKYALKQFQTILEQDYDIVSICNVINNNPSVISQKEIITSLFTIAFADDNFNDVEARIIQKIARHLLISNEAYNRIKLSFTRKHTKNDNENKKQKREEKNKNREGSNSYNKSNSNNSSNSNYRRNNGISVSEAYLILGVSGNMSDAEIKKAYRALAVKYHPDYAANLGDEAIRQATETMKQINVAWEVVKMARRIK